MKSNELKKRIFNLLNLEHLSANKTLISATKNEDSDIIFLSQSYILALDRIKSLINKLITDSKNE